MNTKYYLLSLAFMALTTRGTAQVEPAAGNWKTWFIDAGKNYRLQAPGKPEINQVLAVQQHLDAAARQQMLYWNAGAPGYRWQALTYRLWMSGQGEQGVLAYMLLGTATYDATVAAWDTKYAYKRPRPFEADKRVQLLIPAPGSPSYPCEHSVAAGVAVTLITHFFPSMADSVQRMAEREMASRVAAGVAFPSDTRAGFDLGKRIAEKEIEATQGYISDEKWDGKVPDGPGLWTGANPAAPLAGAYKTVVLESGSQFRPGPPPDYAQDMAELKAFRPNFRTNANAYFYAFQPFWEDLLNKKIFEYNLHLNPPEAARLYATAAVGYYDGFVACWDAKYAYWGIRPNQYDTTYQPPLLITPPFPGYPSGHAAISAVMADLYSDFFPAERAFFQQKADECAESRFQAGIHFRTDNEVGLELGRKVAAAILKKGNTRPGPPAGSKK